MSRSSRPEGGSGFQMSRVLRWLLIAVGLALAVVLLFTIVFPWFDRTFVDDPTMDASPAEVEAVG